MKNISQLFRMAFSAISVLPLLFIACTDMDGNGEGTIDYDGSTLPQNTSYRNPVWEPDCELGTVFKGASTYTAIASETEWATGLKYCAPILTSSNLMDWNMSTNTAFNYNADTVISGTDTTIYKRPDWAEGRIHSLTAGFTKTVPGTSYWLFYQIGDVPAIGVACGRSAQGPYSDFGKLIGTELTGSQRINDPFFFIKGTNTYLLYSTEGGTFVQQLTLKRSQIPTLTGTAIKITGASFTDVALYVKNDLFYLFGTVENNGKTEIHYGRAESLTGPYTGVDGADLLNGNGTLLIDSSDKLTNPCNVCGVFADFNETDFLLYNVTDPTKPILSSGYNRRPLVLNKIEFTESGWINGIVTPTIGWTSPKFIDKE